MKLYSGSDGSYELRPSSRPGRLCLRLKIKALFIEYDLTPEQAKMMAAQLEEAADFVLLKRGLVDNG